MVTQAEHIPVMVNEVIDVLSPRDGGIYVDGTFGRGGYSKAILNAAKCTVWGIDQDPEAVNTGRQLEQDWPAQFHMLEGRFGDMESMIEEHCTKLVDGIALDLGVSSPQLEQAERGFSFRHDGPLDMRMGKSGPTAADLVNNLSEEELADIIYLYGEERRSRRVARKIIEERAKAPITRTLQLAEIVRSVVPKERRGIDPATRTFQALRIKVNDELGELERGLEAAEKLLNPGGRLAVVSFHSLEDRTVKQFLKDRCAGDTGRYRHLPPIATEAPDPTFKMLFRKALKPSAEEAARNPRSKSARLRAAIRTNTPVGGST